MNKSTKIGMAAGIAALAAIGGVAQARMGWHHGGGHMMQEFAERYDANKDGKISQEEIDQNRTARHGEFDADKNATLSLDEFKALWMKAHQERMVREFQEFDVDGNAQVTLDEYKKPMEKHVAEMDMNGDGTLSRDDHHGKQGMRHRGMMDDEEDGKKDSGEQ